MHILIVALTLIIWSLVYLLSFPFLLFHLLRVWRHVDSLAALASVPSEAQISDPFAPEPAPPATTAEATAAAASASTTTTVTAVTADVDLFGG